MKSLLKISLLLTTLLACARPAEVCMQGKQCSNDACTFAHPNGKMFCKLTPCEGGQFCYASHCDLNRPPEGCIYLHQCPNEKCGRKRCSDQDCTYDHINNIAINQAQQVVRQVGGTCQSHALASWLTNWIETSSDPEYVALAERFRCKAEGHRLYDVMVRHFAEDFDSARAKREDFNDWLQRMVKQVIPAGHVHEIEADQRWSNNYSRSGRSSQVRHLLAKKDMPLIFVMRTTTERMDAFGQVETFGDQKRDSAFQKFWRLKDSCAKNPMQERRGHAMLCCPDPLHGGFAIKNSWGKDWAKDGIVYLRPWRCDEDSDFTFHQIEIPDHAPLNHEFFVDY